jgi:molybdopterin-containing oxidoreductase family membrane subunit
MLEHFAVLLLFRQLENGTNRSAEAMTIFSAVIRGLFPIIHMVHVHVLLLPT